MQNPSKKPIIIWLLCGCFLIFSMVILGGITRLTNSGLSMVEWKLLMGVLPPMNPHDWHIAFEKYKQFPEYQLINYHFTLEQFKGIFFWEYLHRLLGRMIGLVFIIPFIYFLIKKRIDKKLLKQLVIILLLGAFQGFMGWYMVKSGLNKNPDVSHFRLAAHLLVAFITFAYTFWVALCLIFPQKQTLATYKLRNTSVVLLLLLLLQICWGAFVAGLNAGKVYNTWPKMGDSWIAASVTAMKPFWINFVDGLGGVQFIHRYLAYIVVATVIYLTIKAKRQVLSSSQSKGINVLISIVLIQFTLGVLTLLFGVPIWLGLLHQLGAFLLLGTTVFVLHRFSFLSEAQQN